MWFRCQCGEEKRDKKPRPRFTFLCCVPLHKEGENAFTFLFSLCLEIFIIRLRFLIQNLHKCAKTVTNAVCMPLQGRKVFCWLKSFFLRSHPVSVFIYISSNPEVAWNSAWCGFDTWYIINMVWDLCFLHLPVNTTCYWHIHASISFLLWQIFIGGYLFLPNTYRSFIKRDPFGKSKHCNNNVDFSVYPDPICPFPT